MKKVFGILCVTIFIMVSCKSSEKTSDKVNIYKAPANSGLNAEVSLLNLMRRLPGVIIRNNRPVITKTQPGFSNAIREPLYILNDYIVGSSFASLKQVVDVKNVKKISILDEANAAIYGSRAGNGVIVVETYQ